MEEMIALSIVGLGAMGAESLEVAARHPELTVRLAADLREDVLARLRREHPAITFTSDPLEAIASPLVDAVYIATPPATHARLAIAALRAGKAVFCEKPLAVDIADGEAMVQVAAETRLACAVNFSLSDRWSTREIERAIRAGEVGSTSGVDVRLCFPVWPRAFQADATWLGRREQGGFMREVFSHFAYLTDRLMGPLRALESSVRYGAGDGASEIEAHGLLQAGDVPVRVTARSQVAGPETYEWILWGTRRSYKLTDWGHLFASDGGPWRPVEQVGERGSEATRFGLFARAMRGEQVPDLAGFEAALRVQRAVEAFHRSAR